MATAEAFGKPLRRGKCLKRRSIGNVYTSNRSNVLPYSFTSSVAMWTRWMSAPAAASADDINGVHAGVDRAERELEGLVHSGPHSFVVFMSLVPCETWTTWSRPWI